MNYTVALSVAAKAATYLQDNQANMSFEESAVHVSALDLALKAIAKHYSEDDAESDALAELASLFDMYAHDSESLANRGLDLRRNSERAKVWREAAADVRSIKLV